MRRAVAWSHDLLDPEEKILFRRLSVFVGGFTLEAAGAVCDAAKDLRKSIIELLSSLVDKSLLRQHDGGVRFAMLQVIREFALERLEETEESGGIKRKHVSFFLRMVEEAAPELTGPNQSAWLDRIELEHDNLRAILHQLVQGGESALSMRFAAALWRFWHIRGYLSEGRDWLVKVLADKTLTDPIRPKLINGAGMIAREQGDYAAATAFFKDGLALAQQLGDMPAAATSLNSLGLLASDQGDCLKALGFFSEALEIRRKQDDRRGTGNTLNNIALAAQEQGEYDKANKFFEESLAIRRELGDRLGIAQSLNNLGIVAQLQGDYERAHAFYEESLHLCRELGNKVGVAQALNNLGIGARQQGDYKNAQELLEESLAVSREVGSKVSIASTLECLGLLAFKQNDCKKAIILYSESLTIFKELRATSGICCCLEDLAGVASALGGSESSAQLFGAAEALRENIHKPLAPIEREDYNHNVATARDGMDEETFATAWAQGRSMTLSEAIAHALAYAGSAS
jgi:tetratricopeptide (TPR) repeat protein